MRARISREAAADGDQEQEDGPERGPEEPD
jgi:hypothetical protein